MHTVYFVLFRFFFLTFFKEKKSKKLVSSSGFLVFCFVFHFFLGGGQGSRKDIQGALIFFFSCFEFAPFCGFLTKETKENFFLNRWNKFSSRRKKKSRKTNETKLKSEKKKIIAMNTISLDDNT